LAKFIGKQIRDPKHERRLMNN